MFAGLWIMQSLRHAQTTDTEISASAGWSYFHTAGKPHIAVPDPKFDIVQEFPILTLTLISYISFMSWTAGAVRNWEGFNFGINHGSYSLLPCSCLAADPAPPRIGPLSSIIKGSPRHTFKSPCPQISHAPSNPQQPGPGASTSPIHLGAKLPSPSCSEWGKDLNVPFRRRERQVSVRARGRGKQGSHTAAQSCWLAERCQGYK